MLPELGSSWRPAHSTISSAQRAICSACARGSRSPEMPATPTKASPTVSSFVTPCRCAISSKSVKRSLSMAIVSRGVMVPTRSVKRTMSVKRSVTCSKCSAMCSSPARSIETMRRGSIEYRRFSFSRCCSAMKTMSKVRSVARMTTPATAPSCSTGDNEPVRGSMVITQADE
eukprot:jgi/Chrpa1/8489/Chrysochromulina_OHIO_Genome00015681-RA